MQHLRTHLLQGILGLFVVLGLLGLPATAQSFRGGLNGSVADGSGAVIAGANVTLTSDDTGATRALVSTSAGEFAFQDLPVGSYTVSVAAPGFGSEKVSKVLVSAGSIYTLPVKLNVSSSSTTVEVDASAVALDTTTFTQTTDLPVQVVNDEPSNGRDFTQLIQFTPGFGGYSIGGGAGAASVNGTRSNQVNWQIDGTDNNDLWWNIPAVNQGGVSGIAGVVLPLDAIDQFSFVTTGTPDSGRNAGGTANLSIKSGTNQIHGSAYYYNRNEFFAATTPFAPSHKKDETRNVNDGFSVGGPIRKDKLFYFISFEHQGFVIGAAASKTEPSAAYQAEAANVLGFYGIPVNPVSTALLNNLWPASALTGPAQSNNYFNPGNENGHSYNSLGKIDYNLNSSNTISLRAFLADGNQTAPTSSELSPYFEVAPIHVENYSVVYNHVFTPRLTNQLFLGVSYFDQVFSDAQHNYDPVALGLNTGVTDPTLSGSPRITLAASAAGSGLTGGSSGFDPIGVTAPSGRQDITGHLDDTVSYTVGKHQFRFGGEYRNARVYDFYQTNARGNFTFDGSQGPWAQTQNAQTGTVTGGSAACDALATGNKNAVYGNPNGYDGNVFILADFLAGCVSNSTIAQGNQKRQVFENTFDLFAQDAWQFTSKLSVNYGLRYDYAQAIHDSNKDLTSFDPSFTSGFAVQGSNVSNLYVPYKGAISPRAGLAYALTPATVIRAGGGVYFDTVYMLPLLNLRGTTDSGALGIGNNPGGANPVVTQAASGYVIESGQPIFKTLANALAGAGVTNVYSVNPHFRPSYTYSYNVNLQQSLGKGVLMQIGYLGTQSRALTEVQDINEAGVGSAFYTAQSRPASLASCNTAVYSYQQCSRPYFAQFPNIGTINQLESNLNSNYNSLQTILRTANWHGLTSQATYTWSHALDYETGLVPYLPQNSFDTKAEYGNSDFDTRNTFTTYVNYQLPHVNFGPERLANGWEVNGVVSLHGGQPFTVIADSNTSGNGDYADRVNVTGISPFAGVSHAITGGPGTGNAGSVTWFNPAAFSQPAQGSYGNERRNQYFNPGFEDFDLSLFKTTRIAERLSLQLRAEMFNVFNRTNLAPIGAPQTTNGAAIGSTIGSFFGAPGIGPGEPFNVQFAAKILF